IATSNGTIKSSAFSLTKLNCPRLIPINTEIKIIIEYNFSIKFIMFSSRPVCNSLCQYYHILDCKIQNSKQYLKKYRLVLNLTMYYGTGYILFLRRYSELSYKPTCR